MRSNHQKLFPIIGHPGLEAYVCMAKLASGSLHKGIEHMCQAQPQFSIPRFSEILKATDASVSSNFPL